MAEAPPAVRVAACLDGARYEEGDALGAALAHASLAPYLMLVWWSAVVYTRRDPSLALALAGMVATAGAASLVKDWARQPRPPATCAALSRCGDYGLPSSHAALAAFALVLHALHQLRPGARLASMPAAQWRVEQVALAGLAAVVAYSRVYLGYHDWLQVLAGGALGAVAAAACVACIAAAEECVWPRLLRWQWAGHLRLTITAGRARSKHH